MEFKFGSEYPDQKASVGDSVQLQKQVQNVVACQETNVPMLNIDADQLAAGDLVFIKKLGLTISNPSTDKPVALGVDFKPDTWGHRIAEFFKDDSSEEEKDDEDEDDDDDSSFFSPALGGAFLGGLGSGGFHSFGGGSSFGGFSGGHFSGGGASRGF